MMKYVTCKYPSSCSSTIGHILGDFRLKPSRAHFYPSGIIAPSAGLSSMISASSSTLRAARKLIVEPLVCLEHHRTWTASLSQLQQRSYHKGGPASEQQPRQPPHSVPTAPRLGPRTKRSSSNSQIKTKTPGGNPERPKRLLEPYVLSRRLTALASRGQLNDAVVMLQNSPSDATNVKTWNTLLLHCMMEKRFKLGYKLFTDVRVPFSLEWLWRMTSIVLSLADEEARFGTQCADIQSSSFRFIANRELGELWTPVQKLAGVMGKLPSTHRGPQENQSRTQRH